MYNIVHYKLGQKRRFPFRDFKTIFLLSSYPQQFKLVTSQNISIRRAIQEIKRLP